jgi:hypothetical protein
MALKCVKARRCLMCTGSADVYLEADLQGCKQAKLDWRAYHIRFRSDGTAPLKQQQKADCSFPRSWNGKWRPFD